MNLFAPHAWILCYPFYLKNEQWCHPRQQNWPYSLDPLSNSHMRITADSWLHVSRRTHMLAFTLPSWWLWYDRGKLTFGWELAKLVRKCWDKNTNPYSNMVSQLQICKYFYRLSHVSYDLYELWVFFKCSKHTDLQQLNSAHREMWIVFFSCLSVKVKASVSRTVRGASLTAPKFNKPPIRKIQDHLPSLPLPILIHSQGAHSTQNTTPMYRSILFLLNKLL